MKIAARIRQLLSASKAPFRLEGEGILVPIVDPTQEIIRHELERLRSAGPSHLALVTTDGSYLQAAGNAKRMTVEHHLVGLDRTMHVVLGRQGAPGPTTTIVSTAGSVSVSASEVWAAPEVVDLFAAFITTATIAPDVTRRDIWPDVLRSQAPPESPTVGLGND